MKMNWGTGIFITIVVFLIGMISLVIISSMQPLNLVTPDYYPKAIDYQSQIDRLARTNNLEDKMVISQDANQLYLQFPKISESSKPQGTVLIFFPRDNHLDKEYLISVDDSLIQALNKSDFIKGRCIVKVQWEQDSLEYYYEEGLMLN